MQCFGELQRNVTCTVFGSRGAIGRSLHSPTAYRCALWHRKGFIIRAAVYRTTCFKGRLSTASGCCTATQLDDLFLYPIDALFCEKPVVHSVGCVPLVGNWSAPTVFITAALLVLTCYEPDAIAKAFQKPTVSFAPGGLVPDPSTGNQCHVGVAWGETNL